MTTRILRFNETTKQAQGTRRRRKALGLVNCLIVAFALAGCVPSSAQQSSEQQLSVRAVNDPFKSDIEYQAPEVNTIGRHKFIFGEQVENSAQCLLRGWKNKQTGAIRHQLYMDITYASSGWRFYNSATLRGGQPLPFVPIDREVVACGETNVCVYEETFAVDLSDSQLRSMAAAGAGVSVEVHSRAAHDDVFSISSDYIHNYVAEVDAQAPLELTK